MPPASDLKIGDNGGAPQQSPSTLAPDAPSAVDLESNHATLMELINSPGTDSRGEDEQQVVAPTAQTGPLSNGQSSGLTTSAGALSSTPEIPHKTVESQDVCDSEQQRDLDAVYAWLRENRREQLFDVRTALVAL